MSEKTEAAQKWAEAKESLEAAQQAYEQAAEALGDAETVERSAWEALEALSGREKPKQPVKAVKVQVPNYDHSLLVKPIG